jgi:hypothetical protein
MTWCNTNLASTKRKIKQPDKEVSAREVVKIVAVGYHNDRLPVQGLGFRNSQALGR